MLSYYSGSNCLCPLWVTMLLFSFILRYSTVVGQVEPLPYFLPTICEEREASRHTYMTFALLKCCKISWLHWHPASRTYCHLCVSEDCSDTLLIFPGAPSHFFACFVDAYLVTYAVDVKHWPPFSVTCEAHALPLHAVQSCQVIFVLFFFLHRCVPG